MNLLGTNFVLQFNYKVINDHDFKLLEARIMNINLSDFVYNVDASILMFISVISQLATENMSTKDD